MPQQLSTNTFGVAKWVVSPTAYLGTHTTIGSALTSASSGDTVYILPGTYTENITAKAGINVCALNAQGGTVTIIGLISANITGTMSFHDIRFQTNGNYILQTSGSNASTINFYNCYWNCADFYGGSFQNSNVSSQVNFYNCSGNLGITGIAFFINNNTGSQAVSLYNCIITNTGGSSAPINGAAGTIKMTNVECYQQLQQTSGCVYNITDCVFDTSALNIECFRAVSVVTGSSLAMNTRFASGTASALSIASSASMTLLNCAISSSNTNAVTGSGTLVYSPIAFYGSSSGMNVTTRTIVPSGPGGFKGLNTGTPGSGFIGEQLVAFLDQSSAITLTNATGANVRSLSLTAGIWDVTGIVMFNGAITGTLSGASVSNISATVGTVGNGYITTPAVSTTGADLGVVIPTVRISITSTTTTYLVAICNFTAGTAKAYGRVSAVRVG